MVGIHQPHGVVVMSVGIESELLQLLTEGVEHGGGGLLGMGQQGILLAPVELLDEGGDVLLALCREPLDVAGHELGGGIFGGGGVGVVDKHIVGTELLGVAEGGVIVVHYRLRLGGLLHVVAAIFTGLVHEIGGIVFHQLGCALAALVAGLELLGGGVGVDEPLQFGEEVIGLLHAYGAGDLALAGVEEEEGGIGIDLVGLGDGDALAFLGVDLDADEVAVHIVAYGWPGEHVAGHDLTGSAPGCHHVDEHHLVFCLGGCNGLVEGELTEMGLGLGHHGDGAEQ